LVDIFYPFAGTVFSKEGVFQQPRDFTPTSANDPAGPGQNCIVSYGLDHWLAGKDNCRLDRPHRFSPNGRPRERLLSLFADLIHAHAAFSLHSRY
jgi:hypothetical protein